MDLVLNFGCPHPLHQFRNCQSTSDLSTTIDWDFLASDRVNSDLATEEKQVVAIGTEREVEDSSILEKELALFRKEELVGREVEFLRVHIGIGEVCVQSKIRHQI